MDPIDVAKCMPYVVWIYYPGWLVGWLVGWVGGWLITDYKASLSPAELGCCWNWAELGKNSGSESMETLSHYIKYHFPEHSYC